jgi:hypothetical protein
MEEKVESMRRDHQPGFFIDEDELEILQKLNIHIIRHYFNDLILEMKNIVKHKDMLGKVIATLEATYKVCEEAILHEHG